ncbi:MAG: S8 family peptidase [Bacteroidetes bacterium]|nr:S8 family peptidase [Bacteroidota bacterium]
MISNSWRYTPYADDIAAAIGRARTQGRNGLGSIVVFSSGNSNPHPGCYGCFHGVTFPANVDGVITVGAIDKNGSIWNYSSRGSEMDLVAPSGNTNLNGDIRTIDRMGIHGYETSNYTTRFGGTSASCPQVSGVVALMLSSNPFLTETQVRTTLQQTATDMGATGFDNTFGFGRVNAYATVEDVRLYVTGPTLVCTSNSTFTLHNRPAGTTVNWEKSPYLNYVSGQGTNNYTVKAKSIASDISWVKATINGDCGDVTIQKDVWAGEPYFFHIRLVDYNTGSPIYELCRGEFNYIQAEYIGSSLAGVDNNWDWQSSEFNIGFPLYPDKSIGLIQPFGSYGTIYMKAHNQCGYSYQNSFGLSVIDCGGWFFGMSPNPSDDYVDITATKNDKAENASEYYEVKIYNSLKVAAYQIGKTKEPLLRINTKQFQNGVYFVHFTAGDQVVVKQLVVSH